MAGGALPAAPPPRPQRTHQHTHQPVHRGLSVTSRGAGVIADTGQPSLDTSVTKVPGAERASMVTANTNQREQTRRSHDG